MLADDIMDPKRADWVLTEASDPAVGLAVTQRNLIKAEKFFLGDSALEAVMKYSYTDIPTILRMLPIVRLPFQSMWVEFSLKQKLICAKKYLDVTDTKWLDEVRDDQKVGFLLNRTETGFTATCIQHWFHDPKNTDNPKLLWSPWPIQFEFSTEPRFEPNRTGALAFGYMAGADFPFGNFNLVALSKHSQVKFIGSNIPNVTPEHPVMKELLGEISGSTRFLCVLLATINAVPIKYVDSKPQGRRIINGKVRGYFSARSIDIMIPAKIVNVVKYMKKQLNSAVSRHRAHMVRGHWRHYPDRTIWVNEHQRGDSSLGWVRHNYNIVGESDK